ncbi:MAG TPA: hypothetical protein DEA08_04610 [Planctomycetes bacterium]|nr:hypothetical protein [Planctomycetota bacterium]
MDAELERARRAAESGGAPERLALLHALRRSGQALGEAWPQAQVSVELEEGEQLEAVLAELAHLDPARLLRNLRWGEEAHLVRAGGGMVMVERDYSERLRVGWNRYREEREPWPRPLWDGGQPPELERLALGPRRLLAVQDVAGGLRVGSLSELSALGARWRAALPPLRALGFYLGGARPLLIALGAQRLWGYDLEGALQLEHELPAPADFAAVHPQGGVALASGPELLHLDPESGAARWRLAAAAALGGSRLEGVALGRLRVAAWGPKLGEWRVSTGKQLRVKSVGTKQEQRRWEDPESTMGMGRDVREWTETVPGDPFEDAAYLGEKVVARQARQVSVGRSRVELEGFRQGRLTASEQGWAICDTPYKGSPVVRLFDAEGGQRALPQPGKVADLALDARHLFVGSREGTLRWYDASTGEERQPVRLA